MYQITRKNSFLEKKKKEETSSNKMRRIVLDWIDVTLVRIQ